MIRFVRAHWRLIAPAAAVVVLVAALVGPPLARKVRDHLRNDKPTTFDSPLGTRWQPDYGIQSTVPLSVAPSGATHVVSPTGDDHADGTAEHPWKTLGTAIGRLAPGDTLLLRGGTYQGGKGEAFTIKGVAGSAQKWTTIAAFPGETPLVKVNSYWQGFDIEGSSYLEIRGLDLAGTAESDKQMTDGIEIRNSHHVRVIDNVVHDMGGCGICSIESDRIHIEGNEVFNTSRWNVYQTSGISLFQLTNNADTTALDDYNNVITRNRVHNVANEALPGPGMKVTDGNCVIIDDGRETNYSGTTLVANNLCFDNGGRGIHVFKTNDVTVVNNTSVGNLLHPDIDGGELTAFDAQRVVFRNNLVKANPGRDGASTTDSPDTVFDHNVFIGEAGDAGRANTVVNEDLAPNFMPAATSAVVDAGSSDRAPTVDLTGRRRDAKPDVGAFELIR